MPIVRNNRNGKDRRRKKLRSSASQIIAFFSLQSEKASCSTQRKSHEDIPLHDSVLFFAVGLRFLQQTSWRCDLVIIGALFSFSSVPRAALCIVICVFVFPLQCDDKWSLPKLSWYYNWVRSCLRRFSSMRGEDFDVCFYALTLTVSQGAAPLGSLAGCADQIEFVRWFDSCSSVNYLSCFVF